MFHVPEKFRMLYHPLYGRMDSSNGNNGVFNFFWQGYDIYCIASDEGGWEHVSISTSRKRTPTWEIMCRVKDLFWDEEDCVIQFHPPRSQYVNDHKDVLHLWRPTNKNIETPPKWMV